METIISYIDNLFRNYPDTEQVRKVREEMLAGMEDKYNELKAEGKSENEAIGIVISEFGSIDELAEELGLERNVSTQTLVQEDDRPEMKLTLEQAKNYISMQTDFGVKIGIGVVLCILSPVISCITEALAMGGFISEHISEAFGSVSLFLMVAVAVGIFVTSGISMSKYEDYKKCRILLDYGTKTLITEQFEKYSKVFGTKIATGIVLCILSVIPTVLLDTFFEGTAFEWIAEMAGGSIFIFVSAGVFLFITAGMKQGAYEVLLGKGDYAPEKQHKRKGEKIIGVIAAIYWPVMVAVYLIWSFATYEWEITWVIWPVAGVIFGGISAVIALVCDK